MNILVNLVHPYMPRSRVNSRWKQELELTPDVTVNDLYKQMSG